MIILGIDPGLAITGYGLIKFETQNSKFEILKYGCIVTSAKIDFAQRLKIIYDELKRLVRKYQPQRVAIEKIYFAKNTKTAMQVGEARGVITLVAVQNKIPVFGYTPLQVKQCLTGYGQASKQQVQKMVKVILNLKEIPKPDDAADGLAVAIVCAQMEDKMY